MTAFDKTTHHMKNPLVILAYTILVVLVYLYIDRDLTTYFHQLSITVNLKPLKYLTSLGLWFLYVALFLAAGIYFRFIKKHTLNETNSWFLLACVLVPNIINGLLKIGFGRARPELLFSDNLFGFYWFQLKDAYWSFPSGHAVTVAAVVSGLAVLVPKYFYLFLSIALLVVVSRVMLCRHYLSDVMVGFYFSMLLVSYMRHYIRKT